MKKDYFASSYDLAVWELNNPDDKKERKYLSDTEKFERVFHDHRMDQAIELDFIIVESILGTWKKSILEYGTIQEINIFNERKESYFRFNEMNNFESRKKYISQNVVDLSQSSWDKYMEVFIDDTMTMFLDEDRAFDNTYPVLEESICGSGSCIQYLNVRYIISSEFKPSVLPEIKFFDEIWHEYMETHARFIDNISEYVKQSTLYDYKEFQSKVQEYETIALPKINIRLFERYGFNVLTSKPKYDEHGDLLLINEKVKRIALKDTLVEFLLDFDKDFRKELLYETNFFETYGELAGDIASGVLASKYTTSIDFDYLTTFAIMTTKKKDTDS